MKGRLWAVVMAVTILGMGLTGCIEAFESFGSQAGISAMEDRDLADNAAAAWNPQAFLVGAITVETQTEDHEVPLDVKIGDGLAPFWYYAYAAPETDEIRVFRVTMDGRVTAADDVWGESLRGQFDAVPLEPWQIDSKEAAEIARTDERFSAVLGVANASVLSGVGAADDEGPTWMILSMSETDFAMVFVDAETGELETMDVEMPDFTMPTWASVVQPPVVHLEEEGTLGGGEPRIQSWPFEVGAGFMASLDVSIERSVPTDSLVWTVRDAEDQVVEGGQLGNWFGRDSGSWEFTFKEAGSYTLHLRSVGATGSMLPDQLGEVDFKFMLHATPPDAMYTGMM